MLCNGPPLNGITNAQRWGPIITHWECVKASDIGSCPTPLCPWVDKEWHSSLRRNATVGTAQATLTRIEREFGFANNLNVHSPRSWYATLTNQLLYSREDREKIGHWSPGILMPDLYDRATCATELRSRGEILEKIRGGAASGRSI